MSLCAAIVAGIPATIGAAEIASPVQYASLSEKGALCLLETASGVLAALTAKHGCAVMKGSYPIEISTDAWGTGKGAIERLSMEVAQKGRGTTMGERWVVDNAQGTLKALSAQKVAGQCVNDRRGSVIDVSGLVQIDASTELRYVSLVGASFTGELLVNGSGLTATAQNGFPNARSWQTWTFRRPNGADGKIKTTRRLKALDPDGKWRACQLIIDVGADDFGDGLDLFGTAKIK